VRFFLPAAWPWPLQAFRPPRGEFKNKEESKGKKEGKGLTVNRLFACALHHKECNQCACERGFGTKVWLTKDFLFIFFGLFDVVGLEACVRTATTT
jgi:hypothetical protein